MKRLHGLAYQGGKSQTAIRGSGRWVANLLPKETDVCYVEPFAGMLGILLQRERCKREIINDKEENIITWWRMVRDNPNEMYHRLMYTPYSRKEYEDSLEIIHNKSGSDLDIAIAVYVVLSQSMSHGLAAKKSDWARMRNTNESANVRGHTIRSIVEPLADRLRHVQLECRDALRLISDMVDKTDTVIYCDPPYQNTTSKYTQSVDFAALGDLLKSCKGRVALSGYNKEWDHLGWRKYNKQAFNNIGTKDMRSKRVESLWVNY